MCHLSPSSSSRDNDANEVSQDRTEPPRRRRVAPSRSSSTKKLLPILALGELGRSDSFTLKAPSSAKPAMMRPDSMSSMMGRRNSKMRRSCPDLGAYLNEFSRSYTALDMMPGGGMSDMPTFNLADAASPMLDAASEGAKTLQDIGASFLSDTGKQTNAEAEGMNLISHALLDFPAAAAQAAVASKAAEVAGRLFVLGQGMLPGHEMMHDELAFQIGFLAVSCNALYQTVMPKIKAAQASKYLTPEDRKAFKSLFKPAGLSWTQYKEMNQHSMEWVTLEAGQTINMDDAFFLCKGAIEMEGGETVEPLQGLIGEDHIAKTLGIFNGEDISSRTAVAGPEGAKVLKMNTQKMGRMMKHDPQLNSDMGRVLFNSMRGKIQRVSRNHNNKKSSGPAFGRSNTR